MIDLISLKITNIPKFCNMYTRYKLAAPPGRTTLGVGWTCCESNACPRPRHGSGQGGRGERLQAPATGSTQSQSLARWISTPSLRYRGESDVYCFVLCNYFHFHFTLLSLKGYAFYNSWSHLKYMGWSQQNANEFPDVYTTRTIQPGDINMTHLAFNILMATGTKLLL